MQIRSDGKKFRTESEIRELVSKYKASELTQSRFCELEGIGLSSLHKWLRKYGSSESIVKSGSRTPGKFVELKDSRSIFAKGSQYQIELELPHGIVLRLS